MKTLSFITLFASLTKHFKLQQEMCKVRVRPCGITWASFILSLAEERCKGREEVGDGREGGGPLLLKQAGINNKTNI